MLPFRINASIPVAAKTDDINLETLILRNSVERFWSNLAMCFNKYGYADIDCVPKFDIEMMFESKIHRRSAQYSRTINIWRRHFSEEQLHIAFFEQIEEPPLHLPESLHYFLGVQK